MRRINFTRSIRKKITKRLALGMSLMLTGLGVSACATTASAANEGGASALGRPLKLTFRNIEPETGKLWVSVCTEEQLIARDSGEAFNCEADTRIAAVEDAEVTFDNLPAGTYAATAFHDDNDNGALDFDDRGIPFEATGNARNARGSFGPPTFDQMKIVLEPAAANPSPLTFEVRMYKVEVNF